MVLTCSIAPRRDTSSTDNRLDSLIKEVREGNISQEEINYLILKQLKLHNIHLEKLSDLENTDIINDIEFDEDYDNGNY